MNTAEKLERKIIDKCEKRIGRIRLGGTPYTTQEIKMTIINLGIIKYADIWFKSDECCGFGEYVERGTYRIGSANGYFLKYLCQNYEFIMGCIDNYNKRDERMKSIAKKEKEHKRKITEENSVCIEKKLKGEYN